MKRMATTVFIAGVFFVEFFVVFIPSLSFAQAEPLEFVIEPVIIVGGLCKLSVSEDQQ